MADPTVHNDVRGLELRGSHLYIPTDPNHADAVRTMTANTSLLLSTDYVIDESLTLIRARGQRDIALQFGRDAFSGAIGRVHYVTRADIIAAWDVFVRFADKDWSFTDCTTKVVIEQLGIASAFAFDRHFRQFGTVAVVP